ncbi:MAG: hypothetical protein RJA09_2387 [Pseudomonadota bacterium]|jgi:uncharacterized membrane protein (UPF0127 family)
MEFPHTATLHSGMRQHRLRLAVARRFATRLRGLMGVPHWPAEWDTDAPQGLLLPACTSVHGCFVRHPLDLLYLDGPAGVSSKPGTHWSAQVVQTGFLQPWSWHIGQVPPGHRALGWRCRHVLELPAGAIQHCQVRLGDVLELHPWP